MVEDEHLRKEEEEVSRAATQFEGSSAETLHAGYVLGRTVPGWLCGSLCSTCSKQTGCSYVHAAD